MGLGEPLHELIALFENDTFVPTSGIRMSTCPHEPDTPEYAPSLAQIARVASRRLRVLLGRPSRPPMPAESDYR
jgi:hypothetical protein